MNDFKIYQIYYNEDTKKLLDKSFLPLNNSNNLRPDLFEFWPIYNFLQTNHLEPGKFYGFISPKFKQKLGCDGFSLINKLYKCDIGSDVILFSPGFDQICFFLNAFVQGEFHHPGLLNTSQLFFETVNYPPHSLASAIGTSKNTAYSNFFVAKSNFWTEWLRIAHRLYNESEDSNSELFYMLNQHGAYVSSGYDAKMKIFIHERIVSFILMFQENFSVDVVPADRNFPLFNSLYNPNSDLHSILLACDTLKRTYLKTTNDIHLSAYHSLINYIKQ